METKRTKVHKQALFGIVIVASDNMIHDKNGETMFF